MAPMDDTPTETLLSELAAADPAAAVTLADALVARLGSMLEHEAGDAAAAQA